MKKTIISIWLLFICLIAFSETPLKSEKEKPAEIFSYRPLNTPILDNDFIYPAWGFYFDISAGITGINNSNIPSNAWDSQKGLGYILNVGYFHSLSPWFKIKTGVGVSSYKNTIKANGDVPQQSFSDIDNDTYIETLTLSNVEKKYSPMYLSVPLIFEFGNPNIDKVGFYIDLGFKYSYLLAENYSSSGTYSTKGTYEQWEVTLENVPELGFYTDKNLETNASLKKSNFSLVAGAGIFIPVSSVIIFKGGLITNFGLVDIGNNTVTNNNSGVISDEVFNYRAKYIDNSMAVTEGSKTFRLGIEFGLYISHRLK